MPRLAQCRTPAALLTLLVVLVMVVLPLALIAAALAREASGGRTTVKGNLLVAALQGLFGGLAMTKSSQNRGGRAARSRKALPITGTDAQAHRQRRDQSLGNHLGALASTLIDMYQDARLAMSSSLSSLAITAITSWRRSPPR